MSADRQVWKFPVPLEGATIEVPRGAVLRHVGLDPYDDPVFTLIGLWYEVNTSAPKIPIDIRVYGTGHSIPVVSKWLGTVRQGPFMWHVYEEASDG